MKNRKLSIRISEADWQRFHDKAEQADMSLTEYVTACCLGKQIVVIDGLDEVIRQQKAIGRNLNQLTTLANMGKVKTVYLKELTDAYAQVSSLLSDLLKLRRCWNGNRSLRKEPAYPDRGWSAWCSELLLQGGQGGL